MPKRNPTHNLLLQLCMEFVFFDLPFPTHFTDGSWSAHWPFSPHWKVQELVTRFMTRTCWLPKYQLWIRSVAYSSCTMSKWVSSASEVHSLYFFWCDQTSLGTNPQSYQTGITDGSMKCIIKKHILLQVSLLLQTVQIGLCSQVHHEHETQIKAKETTTKPFSTWGENLHDPESLLVGGLRVITVSSKRQNEHSLCVETSWP